MPRGGRRPGSGRKPKLKLVDHQPRQPSSGGTVEPLTPPDELSEPALRVWQRQAPHAERLGTLTAATVMSFARYCRLVALEGDLPPGSADHRGILQRLSMLERQFRLVPTGAAAPSTPAPSVLSRFRKDP